MKAKTCEELFINEYEKLKEEYDDLKLDIEKLRAENERLKNQTVLDDLPEDVTPYRINRPVDTVCISVARAWDMGVSESDFNSMPVDVIRANMEDAEGLRMLGEKKSRYYRENSVNIEFRTFPYTIRYGRNIFLIDFYNRGNDISTYKLCLDGEPKTDTYFTVDMTDDLEKYAYELFYQSLDSYCTKREQDEAKKTLRVDECEVQK